MTDWFRRHAGDFLTLWATLGPGFGMAIMYLALLSQINELGRQLLEIRSWLSALGKTSDHIAQELYRHRVESEEGPDGDDPEEEDGPDLKLVS